MRSSPTSNTVFLSGTPRGLVLGPLRSPARGKPAHYKNRIFSGYVSPRMCGYRCSDKGISEAQRLTHNVVVSRLALRWAAKQPHSRHCVFIGHTEGLGLGAASQPSAGQARSPQKNLFSQVFQSGRSAWSITQCGSPGRMQVPPTQRSCEAWSGQ